MKCEWCLKKTNITRNTCVAAGDPGNAKTGKGFAPAKYRYVCVACERMFERQIEGEANLQAKLRKQKRESKAALKNSSLFDDAVAR